MQDKTWYFILGLDAEPLFLQDDMLNRQISATYVSMLQNYTLLKLGLIKTISFWIFVKKSPVIKRPIQATKLAHLADDV